MNRRLVPSVTGHMEAASTWAPCAGGGDANHVLTGASACSTHVSGCSCLSLAFESRTAIASAVDADSSAAPYGAGSLSKLSGFKLRITAGKSMGFEGIISAYDVANRLYNVIPSIPATGIDETSIFQLFPMSQFTPRNHLNNCDKAVDLGCSAYDVAWAKTVGYAIGATAGALYPQSTPRRLVSTDSDVYIAGGIAGFLGEPAFGIEGVDDSVGSASAYLTNSANEAVTGAASSNLATGGTTTTIVLATAVTNTISPITDYYRGLYVTILEGPAKGDTRLITAYTGSTWTATVYPAFREAPTAASRYVLSYQSYGGMIAGTGTTTTFTLAADIFYDATTNLNAYINGATVTFVAGTCAGTTATITAYDQATRVATVAAMGCTPNGTTKYVLYWPAAGQNTQANAYLIKLQD
jgi:hypothetical protein